MFKKTFLLTLFILGALYLLWPGVTSVNNLPVLPNSLKSNELEDTFLIPNTVAYFSYSRRNEITDLYKKSYQQSFCHDNFTKVVNPFCYFAPVKVNRDVKESFTFIRDQVLSTYLEEYSYPFKNILYINGYEPYDIHGNKFPGRASPILIEDVLYDSKTTLRLYQPSLIAQILVYIGIWAILIFFYKIIKDVVFKSKI